MNIYLTRLIKVHDFVSISVEFERGVRRLLLSCRRTSQPKSKANEFTTVSKKKKGSNKKEEAAAAAAAAAEPAQTKLTTADLYGSGNGKRVRQSAALLSDPALDARGGRFAL